MSLRRAGADAGFDVGIGSAVDDEYDRAFLQLDEDLGSLERALSVAVLEAGEGTENRAGAGNARTAALELTGGIRIGGTSSFAAICQQRELADDEHGPADF